MSWHTVVAGHKICRIIGFTIDIIRVFKVIFLWICLARNIQFSCLYIADLIGQKDAICVNLS